MQRMIATFLRGLSLIARFGLTLLLAITLPLEEIGFFGLYWSAIVLVSSLIGLDLYAATIRKLLAVDETKAQIINDHIGLLLLLSLILLPLTSCLFAYKYSPHVIIFFIILLHFFAEFVAHEIGRILIPLGKPFLANFLLFMRSAAWIPIAAVIIIFAAPQLRLTIIIGSWFISSSITALISIRSLKKIMPVFFAPQFNLPWIKEIFKLSLWLYIGTLMYRSTLGLDRFLVETVLDLKSVGIYTIHASIGLGILALTEVSVSAWRYPSLVTSLQANNYQAAKKQLLKFIIESIGSTIIIGLTVMLIAPQLLAFFTSNKEYMHNINCFYWIVLGVIFYSLSMPMHYIIYGLKYDKLLALIYAIALVVILVMAKPLMLSLGVAGAGLTLGTALFTLALLRFLIGSILFMRMHTAATIPITV